MIIYLLHDKIMNVPPLFLLLQFISFHKDVCFVFNARWDEAWGLDARNGKEERNTETGPGPGCRVARGLQHQARLERLAGHLLVGARLEHKVEGARARAGVDLHRVGV
mgnify:CR=1 FL=1